MKVLERATETELHPGKIPDHQENFLRALGGLITWGSFALKH